MTLQELQLIYLSFGKTVASGAWLSNHIRHSVELLSLDRAHIKLLKSVLDNSTIPFSEQPRYGTLDKFLAYRYHCLFDCDTQHSIRHCWKLILVALSALGLVKRCRQTSCDYLEFKKPFLPNRLWACHHPRDPPFPIIRSPDAVRPKSGHYIG